MLLPFPFNLCAAAVAGAVIVLLSLAGSCGAVVWKTANGQQCPVTVPMPVAYREAMRVIMTAACVRGFFWLPLAVTFGGLAGLAAGAPLSGALIGAKVIAASIAFQQWRFIEFTGMRDSSWREFCHFFVLMILFWWFGFSAMGFTALPVTHLMSTPAAAIMFGAGWLAMRLDERHFHRTASDLLSRGRSFGSTR